VNQSQRLTGASRVFRKTVLVYLSKNVTIADIFLCWKIDLFYIFNVIKDMTHGFIKYVSKTMI